ncbi:MAG: hypothetical protein CL912_14560 [Deltaproteobacteria bacterium]|nr:hypothetical protein [Deltaproteobacteria bacterium]|tara:strand:+ start:1092 stop:1364 length:273 start_codon:yes stop_codon:yes gene_type:complete
MFPSGMLSFQVGASRVFEAFLLLKGNSNFFKQSGFEVKSCSIDSAKRGFGKSKGKVTPLALDGDFEKAGSSKKSHYINTFDIYKLQVHLS